MIQLGASQKSTVVCESDIWVDFDINPESGVSGDIGTIGYGAATQRVGDIMNGSTPLVQLLIASPASTFSVTNRVIRRTAHNQNASGTDYYSYNNVSNAYVVDSQTYGGSIAQIAQSMPALFDKTSSREVTREVVIAKFKEIYGNQYNSFALTGGNPYPVNMNTAQRNSISAIENAFPYMTTATSTAFSSLTSFSGHYYPDLDIYNTDNKALAWAIWGDYNPDLDKLRFDMYLNGADSPQITIKWDKDQQRDLSISKQTINAMIWTYPDRNDYTSPDYPGEPIHNVDGINVVDESFPEVRRNAYTWNGTYSSQYLSIFNNATINLANLTKVVRYGLDGIADAINFYLRFNYSVYEENTGKSTWGDMYRVIVRKETGTTAPTATLVASSAKDKRFDTAVYVHLGPPPGDDDNDDDTYDDGEDSGGGGGGSIDPRKTVPDFTDGESTGYDGKAVLTKTYAMTASVLENIGTKLWTQSYFDVLKIQDNPIENIVSCKWFPFSLTGTTASVKVGNVDFEINASKINSIYTFDVGSVSYPFDDPDHTYSYLDCSPYVSIKLHLPYCGVVQLDASELYGRTLFVKYVVDIVTGDVAALLYLDKTQNNPGVPYMMVSGHAGVDIPLTASNRQQMEIRHASQSISAVVGAGAHILSGDIGGGAAEAFGGFVNVAGMDYTSQRSAAPTSACATKMNRNVFIEVSRPGVDADNSEGFKAIHGYPCHKYKNLGYFGGFVKADSRTKINIAMTSEENAELERLLIEGIFV